MKHITVILLIAVLGGIGYFTYTEVFAAAATTQAPAPVRSVPVEKQPIQKLNGTVIDKGMVDPWHATPTPVKGASGKCTLPGFLRPTPTNSADNASPTPPMSKMEKLKASIGNLVCPPPRPAPVRGDNTDKNQIDI